MSLAENLLNSLDETAYENTRIASGGIEEEHIVVDASRTITVPANLKTIAVIGDKDIETVTFDCVRYWDGHDLSTFAIYINYILPNGDKGTYIPKSITKLDDIFTFDWEIGSEITYAQGKLTFWIVAKLTDDSGDLIKQWSSLQNSECTIARGGDKIYVPEKQTDQDVISQAISVSRAAAERAEEAAERAEAAAGGLSEANENRIKALEDAVADLNYKAISISSFSASPSTAEMGSKVTSVALSWGVNKTPTALTLDSSALGVNDKSKTVTGTFTANKSWKLKATDERGATAEKTTSLTFLNGIYYGVAEEPNTYDSAFLLDGIDRGLKKTLRNSKLTSFSESAGGNEYIYYCLPKRMGTCSFKVGGFDGGFTLVDTIAFTNAFGYSEDYFIYRSDNTGLGQTSVTVS